MIFTTSSDAQTDKALSKSKGMLRASFLSFFRMHRSFFIAYSALTVLFLPLVSIFTIIKNPSSILSLADVFSSAITVLFFVPTYFLAPVLLAPLVSSYLYSRNSVDVWRSLPLTRRELFLGNYFTGAVILTVPLLISYILLAPFTAAVLEDIGITVQLTAVTLYAVVVILAVYSFSLLISAFCSSVFDAFVYSAGILIAVPASAGMTLQFLEWNILGFSADEKLMQLLLMSAPDLILLFSAVDLNYPVPYSLVMLLYAALGVLFFFLGMAAHRKRRSEYIERTDSNSVISMLVKFIAALFLGEFLSLLGRNMGWGKISLFLGFFLGITVGYFLVDIIIGRRFSLSKKSILGYCGSLLLVPFAAVLFCTGGFGYENRIPAVDDIEKVSFRFSDPNDFSQQDITYKDRAAVKAIRALHTDTVPLAREYQDTGGFLNRSRYGEGGWIYDSFPLQISYTLRNGSVITRRYPVSPDTTPDTLLTLMDTEDFREQANPLHFHEESRLTELTLISKLRSRKDLPPDALPADELVTALSHDFAHQRSAWYTGEVRQLGFIEIVSEREKKAEFASSIRSDRLILTEEHTETVAFLEKYGLLSFFDTEAAAGGELLPEEGLLRENTKFYLYDADTFLRDNPYFIYARSGFASVNGQDFYKDDYQHITPERALTAREAAELLDDAAVLTERRNIRKFIVGSGENNSFAVFYGFITE